MNAVLYANIGNRDLGRDGTSIYNLGDNIYKESKRLFERRDFSGLDAILLESVVNYINERYCVENIYLFGTEQMEIHLQDTYYVAAIVKAILTGRYGLDDEKVRVVQITRDPSDRDEMHDFYEKFFNGTKDKEGGIAFVSLTGGTPAQNEALLFNSIARFKTDVQGIYLSKRSREVKTLDISGRIYKKGLREVVDAFKEKFLYEGAIELVGRYGLDEDLELLKAKKYEMLFDFETALRYYKNAIQRYSGERKAELEAEIERLSRLNGGLRDKERFSEEYFLTYTALLEELYKNMMTKWEQGAYVDFLGRLFRFEEGVLRFVFEKETKVSTEEKSGEYHDFQRFVNTDKELYNFLNEKGIKEDKLNRKVLRKVVEFWVRKRGIKRLGRIFRFFDEINTPEGDSLAELRNKSILAHDFVGISRDMIERKYKGNISKDIGEILGLLKDYRTI